MYTGSKTLIFRCLTGSIKLENEILELLVQNLERLNEEEESDRQGVFKTLGTFRANISDGYDV